MQRLTNSNMELAPPKRSPVMKWISDALVVFFNALLLFAVVNVVVALFFYPSVDNGKGRREQIVDLFIQRHGAETLRAAYPGMSDSEIREQLISTAVHGNRYYPYVEFIDASYISPEMLIRPEGYRVIGAEQAPWPPPKGEKTAFIFGSSTALGTGALNHQTIAAYVQKLLRANFHEKINVYNFGTGAHYSTQEILFFFDWIRKGIRPDLAVFIDGLSDHAFVDDRSALSSFLEQDYEKILNSLPGEKIGDQVSAVEHLKLAFFKLPVMQLVLRQHNSEPTGVLLPGVPEALRQGTDFRNLTRPATPEETRLSTIVLDRFTTNMISATGMANANGVQAFFVWQPGPLWKYDLRLHPFEIQPGHQLHRVGYPLMYERYQRGSLPSNFAWCADVQEGRSEMLYVDQVHYRPLLAQLVAECAVKNLLSNDDITRKLGWSRVSSELIVPDMAERLSTPSLQDNLVDLKEIVERQPGRLFPSNVAFEPLKESQQPEKLSVRLAATGAAAEHYFMIATELAEGGEYLLQMQIQPKNATAVRIQAWDKDLQANGVLADVHFGTERVSMQTINRSEASLGQVVRRDQWYDLAIGVRLPAGLSRVLIQLMGPNDNNVFAPDGQSLQIRNFAVRRGSLSASQ
jgi:hypothetical protein